jgi:hypothetical protein
MLTLCFEIHMKQGNQLDALLIFSLLSHYSSTCFRLASSPSSGGSNVYVAIGTCCMCQVTVSGTHTNWYMLYVLADCQWDTYQLVHAVCVR